MPVTLAGPLSIRGPGDLGLFPMAKRSPSRAETCADNRGSEDSPTPGWSRSDPASVLSVLEEGRGATEEQHGTTHQGGGRAAHLAGQERPGGRRRSLHGDGGQRGGSHLLQRHPQRAAR